jgi:galactokinase
MTDPAGADATAWFRECYAAGPQGSWRAPGRVNLIGEHTDYNDGLVLPFAIGLGTFAAAARRADGILELRSRQAPQDAISVRLSELRPGSVTGWAAYPAGIAWALRAAGHQVAGARVAIDSDLPLGAGLSSSAALECAVALALTELSGLGVPRPELVRLAQRAENEFAGMPCGIMDQSASLLGQEGSALLIDCQSGVVTAVPLDPAVAGLALLIIDTGVRHVLADGSYADRRRECEQAARALGLASLRGITDDPEPVSGLSDPVLRRRARHVVTENRRVGEAARLLRAGELAACGALLTASHRSLRDDFEVSWPAADTTVEVALAAGALGARMMGGGFGGSVLVLAAARQAGQIRADVDAAYAGLDWAAPRFLEVAPAAAASRVR